MTMISEKVSVIAREYLDKNINESREFKEPIYQAKLLEFDWDMTYAAPSIVCEIIWKEALRGGGSTEWGKVNRLFSPSPLATHANFRGSKAIRTGNVPEIGAVAFWKKGNGWQGHMAIVVAVSEDLKEFDVIEGRILQANHGKQIIAVGEKKGKRTDKPFKSDQFNLIGFGYPPEREIS